MSKIVVGTGFVLVAAVAAAFYAQQRANAALRRELAGLREELRLGQAAIAAKATTNAARAADATGAQVRPALASNAGTEDWGKLRDEMASLRKSVQELTQLAQAAQAAQAGQALAKFSDNVPTNLTPTESLKNAGKLTPEAAAETVLWAAAGGDVDTLANSIVFTPTAREKAEAWFAGLSENTRQQYGSAEKVLALMIAKDAAALTGMQILGQKEVAPDNVGVRVRFASSDGKTKDDNFLMRRSTDGWRLVLPDNAVEKFAKQLSGRK